MAKIAVVRSQSVLRTEDRGAPAKPSARVLARGDGWTVSEVVCRSGPADRPFEERHSNFSIAVVVSGTFQYRSANGCELMTPGSLLLGNAGQCFSCGHEHGTGDRCVAFSYTPEFFERLAADAAGRIRKFESLRVPPLRTLAPMVAQTCAILTRNDSSACEELSLELAAQALQLERGTSRRQAKLDAASLARVTQVVRLIESQPDGPHDVATLARLVRLSPFHFLRTFEALTGTTPRQFLLRVRLRRAAVRLETATERILDIALDCGFGDVSNFNHAFRAEFGVSPRVYRSRA